MVAIAFALAVIGASQPPSKDPLLDGQNRCEAHLNQLKNRVKRTTLVGGVLSVVGAVVASIGSLAAGFSSQKRARRVSAIVGVIGAALAAAPKLLEEREEVLRAQIAAENHWTAGTKVYNQLDYLPKELTSKAKQYVASRFVDCLKTKPPEDVPDVNDFLGMGIIISMAVPEFEMAPLVFAKGQLTHPDGGVVSGENLRISLSLDSGTANYLVQGENVIIQDESIFGEEALQRTASLTDGGFASDGGMTYVVRKGYVFRMDGGVVQGDRFILDLSTGVKTLRAMDLGDAGPQVRASYTLESVDPDTIPKIIVVTPDKPLQ